MAPKSAELAEQVEQKAAARASGQAKTLDEYIADYLPDLIAAMRPEARERLQESFGRLSLNVIRYQPELRDCDVHSVIGALMTTAAMGLEPPDPGRPDNLVYYRPRNVNVAPKNEPERWVKKVEVAVDYRGLIELAQRTGSAASITADVVHDGDHFEYYRDGSKQRLAHRPAGLLEEPGKVIGSYAVAEMINGSEIVEVCRLSDIERARASSDLGSDSRRGGAKGPWVTDYEAMARKTAVRRLFKWLPKSPEATVAFAADGHVVRDVPVLEAPGDTRPILDMVSETDETSEEATGSDEPEPDVEADPERPFETPEDKGDDE